MKKRTLLTSLLSVAVTVSSAVAFAGCAENGKQSDKNQTADMQKFYAQYVSYTQAEGLTPLPFEEWLEEEDGEFGDGELGDGTLEDGEFGDGEGETEEEICEHVWETEYTYDDEYHWFACELCEEHGEEEEHNVDFTTGVCSDCGGLVGATDGVRYEISRDGEYASVIGYEGTATDVRFADEYEGLPVTKVEAFAFDGNKYLTSVIIPNGVKTIGSYAFRDCDNLTSIQIGAGVTTIENYAFLSMDALTEITVSEENETYASFEGNLYNKERATLLQYAIGKTDEMLFLPETVTKIGDNAFEYCKNLILVELGENVQEIGSRAFRNCDGLTFVALSDGVVSVGQYAFYDCDLLTAVSFGENVVTIGDGAFAGCDYLMSAYIPNSVQNLGSSAFANCDGLTVVQIGDSVQALEDKTFRNCDNLLIVFLGEKVLSIGKETFQNCYSLVGVEIQSELTSIGEKAFQNCWSMPYVELPSSTTEIGESAFENCYRLVEVVSHSSEIALEKGAETYGGIATYAIETYDSEDEYESKLTVLDDGYIVYVDGEETSLVGYLGEETNLVLPSIITNINRYAFYNLKNVTSVVIGENVTYVGEKAFMNCTGLTSVVISESVHTIAMGAFMNCTSLQKIIIPATVLYIEEAVFAWCDGLTICCEAKEQPEDWAEYWKYSHSCVVWAYEEKEELKYKTK